jgi:hypothetical protein
MHVCHATAILLERQLVHRLHHRAPPDAAEGDEGQHGDAGAEDRHCPGREPPLFAVKRPARPYETAIEKRFT